MKNIVIAFTSLLAAVTIFSCSPDLLDIQQKGVIAVDETYANADDQTAEQLIAEVYARVKNLITGDWGIHFLATTTTKVADFWPGGSSANDGGQYQQMAKMVDNSENDAYRDMYQRFYNIIYKCNMIVDKLNDGSPGRKRVIAEAKAWRAWAMMRLTQLWGSAPLVAHVLDGINYSFTPANTPPAESWAWIMEQFDEAAADLPSKSGLGGQRAIGGRWTAETCWAYKGQGYMWQNDYENAKVWLARVINSNKYALWTQTETMGPSSYGANTLLYKQNRSTDEEWIDGSEDYRYLTLFRAKADFCDEYLLEIDTDGDASTMTSPYWFWAYTGWRSDAVFNPGNSNGAAGGDAWGFLNPTRAFGVAFARHDGNSVRRRMSVATYDEVYYDFPYASDGVRGMVGGESGRVFSNQGFFRMKYYNFLDDLHEGGYATGQHSTNRTNFPLLRYSNILLLYAEAVCMSSEGTANISGLEALNMVRSRAGLIDAPALDMDNAEYGIKAERRFELCLEDCDRYVDLIRWGDYKEFILDTSDDGVGDYWGSSFAWLKGFKDPDVPRHSQPWDISNYDVVYDQVSDKGTWDDRLYYWPFPYIEMMSNPNLVQNTGW